VWGRFDHTQRILGWILEGEEFGREFGEVGC